MTKEKTLENLGIVLDNFTPQPNSHIMVTIDQNLIDFDSAGEIMDVLREEFPNKGIIMKVKGVDIK